MICDNCDQYMPNYSFYPIRKLKKNIANKNKDESAILCLKCFEDH